MPYSSRLFSRIRRWAEDFIASPQASIEPSFGLEPAFAEPLLGIAAGDDPLWQSFKNPTVIGEFHWTPLEAFKLAFPYEQAEAADLSVVCWILPQTKATMRDQAKETALPSERWAYSRMIGEVRANTGLRKLLLEGLRAQGLLAVAPLLLPQWGQITEKIYSPSKWSERHAAHVAGLGTFGLCDGLITAKGKAHRVGSLIVKHKMPATPRGYSGFNDYCLFYSAAQACRACIKRCPVGAISEAGHDKVKCSQYLYGVTDKYVQSTWHIEGGYGCGLCQAKVPCAQKNPMAGKN